MNEASPVAEASIVPTVPALWLYRSFASLTRMVPLRLSYAVAVAVALQAEDSFGPQTAGVAPT